MLNSLIGLSMDLQCLQNLTTTHPEHSISVLLWGFLFVCFAFLRKIDSMKKIT